MNSRLPIRAALASVGIGVALFALAGPASANGMMGGGSSTPTTSGGCSSCGDTTATTAPEQQGTITVTPHNPPPHTYTTPPPVVRSTPQPQVSRPQPRPTPRPATPPTTEAPAEPWLTPGAEAEAPATPPPDPSLSLAAQPADNTAPMQQAQPASSSGGSKGGGLPVLPITGVVAAAGVAVAASSLKKSEPERPEEICVAYLGQREHFHAQLLAAQSHRVSVAEEVDMLSPWPNSANYQAKQALLHQIDGFIHEVQQNLSNITSQAAAAGCRI